MKLSGNYLNIFLTYEIKFKLMHWREFADVQIKTVKTQKHLYCLVFTEKVSGFSPVPFFCIIQKGQRDSNSSSIFLRSKKGHKINCSQSEHDGLKTRRVSPSAPGKVSGFSPVPFFCILQKGQETRTLCPSFCGKQPPL